ncbi:MAG: VC0807 family protein [Acetobacteraceae bacterium]
MLEPATMSPAPSPRPRRGALLRDIGVNAVVPYVTYLLLRHLGVAVIPALAAGAVFPAGAALVTFRRAGRIDALGVIMLVATGASMIGALLFTSPYLLLAKGSLITGGIGVLFLGSLAAQRPLVFHLIGSTGQDASGAALYDTLWNTVPPFRTLMRRLTLAWGVVLITEAALRLLLIDLLPIEVFLPVSEVMWIAVFAGMTAWSWRYGARRMSALRSAASD